MPASTYPRLAGFRSGEKGTHTSRTMMLAELEAILAATPENGKKEDFASAALEQNALGKQTAATRKLSLQRLTELYALDPELALFRVLRRLWGQDVTGRPLLALLCSLARDPLLRASAVPVLATRPGEELSRQAMTDAIRTETKDRLKGSTLDKVVRNVSASWNQSGHLEGRVRKFRRQVRATPGALTYALMLGFLQGLRGASLLESEWTRVLDAGPAELRELALTAKRLGFLDIKSAGEIIEIGFSSLLTTTEIKNSRVTH
jgi:hypothetical protein